jgi:hypothetical protein
VKRRLLLLLVTTAVLGSLPLAPSGAPAHAADREIPPTLGTVLGVHTSGDGWYAVGVAGGGIYVFDTTTGEERLLAPGLQPVALYIPPGSEEVRGVATDGSAFQVFTLSLATGHVTSGGAIDWPDTWVAGAYTVSGDTLYLTHSCGMGGCPVYKFDLTTRHRSDAGTVDGPYPIMVGDRLVGVSPPSDLFCNQGEFAFDVATNRIWMPCTTAGNYVDGVLLQMPIVGGGRTTTPIKSLPLDIGYDSALDTVLSFNPAPLPGTARSLRASSVLNPRIGGRQRQLPVRFGSRHADHLRLTTSVVVAAGAGDDTVRTRGSAGQVVYGGPGKDKLRLGGGRDRFAYTSASDSSARRSDQILDLTREDRIDLRAIDAQPGTARNDRFHWVSRLGSTPGQLALVQAGGWTLVQGNLDRDPSPELAIRVRASATVVRSAVMR